MTLFFDSLQATLCNSWPQYAEILLSWVRNRLEELVFGVHKMIVSLTVSQHQKAGFDLIRLFMVRFQIE